MPAGAIFTECDKSNKGVWTVMSDFGSYYFAESTLKNNPDWFEKVMPEPNEFTTSDMMTFGKIVFQELQPVPTFCPEGWLKGLLNKYLRQYRR